MFAILIQKFFVYGCLGLLIEILFTGIWSLATKNYKLTAHTYLWMLPVYAFAGLSLEAVSNALPWPFWLKAFLYVPIIYGIEALSGWTLQRIIGVVPWDYGRSRFTPMGLINLKYAIFWLGLAMIFDPLSLFLRKALNFLARME